MNTGNFNPTDSLKTIEEALMKAKAQKTGASFYYILWGSILFTHYLLLFIASQYPSLKNSMLEMIIWGVFPFGGLLSYLKSKKDNKKEQVLSHYEKVYLFAFSGFALTYGTIFISSAFLQTSLHIALYPLLLGFTVFVVGGITKHKASIIGGILGIICSGISLNVSLEIVYLLAALSSFISCIIPGYLMKNTNV